MKRILLMFLFLILLTSCSNTKVNEKITDSNDKLTVEPTVSEPTLEEETVVLPPDDTTEETQLDSNLGIIKGYSNKYKSHPTSEPSINKQLQTINPLGDISTVWDYYRGDGVTVAVIDSGFDYNHPEFFDIDGNSRIVETSAYIYTDTSGKVNTKVGIKNVGITDGDSHGTMCAGILGGSVNNYGITGIAPNCKLLLIKIDKKSSSFAEAFKYAADAGAKVISTSLGTYTNANGESSGDVIFPKGEDISKTFNVNIKYAYDKGVTIIAATGNSRTTTLSYPAGCDYVIGAGGLATGSMTNIWDNGYEGSNYNGSKVYVDVFAPSEGIYAPGFDTSTNKSTYWSDAKGTSFSSPIIAGAAALYFEKYPNHTNSDFEAALKKTSVNISSYNNNKNMGWGRIDFSKLLSIKDDIENVNYNSSTTVKETQTHLLIEDEAGWDLRTLHIFNLTFQAGYGYKDFEQFLTYYYGARTATSSYQVEGTKRTWAYTDEAYIGDYYLCIGNTDHAKATTYDYYFPSWVIGLSYQVVNNSNWLPEGGLSFSKNSGYGKTINAYFKVNNSSFGITQSISSSFTTNIEAVKVTKQIIGLDTSVNSEIVSIFDKYEPTNLKNKDGKTFIGWFIDEQCTILYTKGNLTEDIILYGLYK